MSHGPEILVAEDDSVIRRAVKAALASEGYSVRETPDGATALRAFGEKRPDLLLLDVMMPETDGFEVCARIRAVDARLPIIFLTARSSEDDKVKGLGLGADDYIVKPFGVRELLARVAAVLRRADSRTPETIPLGAVRLDPRKALLVRTDGKSVALTARELRLLLLFAARPDEVISRDELLNSCWGVTYYGTTRTLDQHILVLRKKLGPEGLRLVSVRSLGYKFAASL